MKFNLNHIPSKQLVQYIALLGPNLTGCEIGVWEGDNSCFMLESCENIKQLIGIDPYIGYVDFAGSMVDEQFTGVIDKLNSNLESINAKERFKLLHMKSIDAINEIQDGQLDFIFIDGSHKYEQVYSDLKLYYNKVKSGGIFSGHDYSLYDVNRALYEFLDEYSIPRESLMLLQNDSWMIYR